MSSAGETLTLETSKGDFAQGIALGAVLMVFALVVTALLAVVQKESVPR